MFSAKEYDVSYWKQPIEHCYVVRFGKTKFLIEKSAKKTETISFNSSELSDCDFSVSDQIPINKLEYCGKSKKKYDLILDEAECIDDDDDEENEIFSTQKNDSNNGNLSFIVNSSEIDDEDLWNQSSYLKSTKNLIGLPNQRKYKLKYDFDRDLDVYSQIPTAKELAEEYEMDSFCNDEIVYMSEKDEEIELDEKLSNRMRKTRQIKKSKQSSTPIRPQKRRRIIIESP
ncbi:TSSC1 protein [Sarcoptes scabiei]|nr:TSSC1 protein [Sarcoptes scabiei]